MRKKKSACSVRNDGWWERGGKKKSACSVRNDGGVGGKTNDGRVHEEGLV
jgi:hypothetical protein